MPTASDVYGTHPTDSRSHSLSVSNLAAIVGRIVQFTCLRVGVDACQQHIGKNKEGTQRAETLATRLKLNAPSRRNMQWNICLTRLLRR